MRILLTNDDGYDAPGLLALYNAIKMLGGVDIDIIAPSHSLSGAGHTISPKVSYRRLHLDEIGEVIAMDGTPPDCVRSACAIPGMQKPDWVIVGVNRGSNLGVDIYSSGTVAAAREAAILQIPAIAISQLVILGTPDDWQRTTNEAAAVISAIIHPDQSPPPKIDTRIRTKTSEAICNHPTDKSATTYWNVNLPRLPADQPVENILIAPLSTDPLPCDYKHRVDQDGTEHLQNVGRYPHRLVSPNTDVSANFNGAITLTPLTL